MFLKRLSPRILFSLTSSSSPSPYSIAQCSTFSSSHLTYPHSHSHPDSRNVRVSVWWDLENCNVPSGVSVFRAAQAITAAIESSGIKGPIQITAYGDMLRLATTNQEALSSTGINLRHIPHGGEDIAVTLFNDLMNWVLKNPPPAHLFLIIVDGGSSFILHRLRIDNYNVLLATKESASGFLKSAATIIWNWDLLVRGENLTGRYFNPSPNGSWYGHYEGIESAAFVPDDQPGGVLQQNHEFFSQDSFWTDMKTFLNTDIGSIIIAESRNREKLAYYLQKYGLLVFDSFTESDVLLVVDMLISKKKWVLESPHLTRRFKLTSAGITSRTDCSDDDFSDSELDCSDDFSDSE